MELFHKIKVEIYPAMSNTIYPELRIKCVRIVEVISRHVLCQHLNYISINHGNSVVLFYSYCNLKFYVISFIFRSKEYISAVRHKNL